MIGFDAMKTEVTSRLGNRTDISSRIDRWINFAFFELLLNPRFSFFELDKLVTFNTVVGIALYDLLVISPDIWHILDLRDLTNVRKLRRSHWQVLDRITVTTGQPTRYARFNMQVQFDPVPDAVYNIQLRYRFRPADLSAGASFDGLGTEWEEVITAMASIRGFEALDQNAKAMAQRQLLESVMATKESVPSLEDADAETTIAPALMYNYW